MNINGDIYLLGNKCLGWGRCGMHLCTSQVDPVENNFTCEVCSRRKECETAHFRGV